MPDRAPRRVSWLERGWVTRRPKNERAAQTSAGADRSQDAQEVQLDRHACHDAALLMGADHVGVWSHRNDFTGADAGGKAQGYQREAC